MRDLESTDGLDWRRIADKVTFSHCPNFAYLLNFIRSLLILPPYLNVLQKSARFAGWVIDIRDLITLLGMSLKSQPPKNWPKTAEVVTLIGCL